MNGEDGSKPTIPTFSSFPVAPSFDSFPVASTSKAALHNGDGELEDSDRESKRRKHSDRHRSQREEGKRHSKRDRRDGSRERNNSGSERHSRRSDDDKRADRHSRNKERQVDDPRHSKESKSRREDRHRHGSPPADRARPSGSKTSSATVVTPQYYNAPNLAYGEVARVASARTSGGQDDASTAGQADYKLFRRDTIGDQDVRVYGKPYKGSIPRYRRLGYGTVIGLPGEFRISMESARTGEGLDVSAGRDFSEASSLGDRKSLRRLTDRSFKRLVLAPGIKATQPTSYPNALRLDTNTDFVKLPDIKTVQQKKENLEHEDGQDYRSVAGAVKSSELDDEDHDWQYSSADEEGAESFEEYLKRRNIEFERHLRAHPAETNTWLELVAFQDTVYNAASVNATKAAKRASTATSRRSLAEIKISILERALSQNGNERSTELHLALLKYGADIWDTKDLMKRWMDLLRLMPEESEVWLEYVTFRQTNSSGFAVQEVVDVFSDCLQRLGKATLSRERGSRERRKLEENYVYLFLRVCLLLRQADYAERALAAFQAMIELNFYVPEQLRGDIQRAPSSMAPVEAALDSLELFWDSEVARIGEEGSLGWCNTPEDAMPSEPGLRTTSAVDVNPEEDPFAVWAKRESSSSQRKRRPMRTTNMNDDDDDPYSTILFSDIRSLLFVISTPDARSQLLYSFLFYLGVPVTPPDTSSTSRLASDTFLHASNFSTSVGQKRRAAFWPSQNADNFLRGLVPFEVIGGQAMEPTRTSSLREAFQPPFRTMPMSPDLLFRSMPRWFCMLDQTDYLTDLDMPFVRNVLAQLRLVSKDIFLTLVHFSVEALVDAKGSVKIAKNILKSNSKNLLFWDAYARIERSNGNLKAARNVYSQALSLSQSFEDQDKVDMPLLWRSWAELEWENGNEAAALAILGASATTTLDFKLLASVAMNPSTIARPGPAGILKARDRYRRLLEQANANDSPQSLFRHRISITFCLALLEYMTSTNAIEACNACMERQLDRLRREAPQSAEEEEALALQAKILFRHTQSRQAFRPGSLRKLLEQALGSFPNNSIFLSLHLFNELRTRIENRVRRALDDLALKDDTVTAEGWLFAIYAELHLSSRGYNVPLVRNLFERAVDNTRTRSSVSIWSLYIEFELRQSQTKTAKRLLHRALAECPWSKDLYLMAFSPPFRDAYRSSELREIHRLMLEKGIRLHSSLEDVVGGWRSEESEEEPDWEALETEDSLYAQRQAAERLRLMPV